MRCSACAGLSATRNLLLDRRLSPDKTRQAPKDPRTGYRLNPAANSTCVKVPTKSCRKILKSSLRARHSPLCIVLNHFKRYPSVRFEQNRDPRPKWKQSDFVWPGYRVELMIQDVSSTTRNSSSGPICPAVTWASRDWGLSRNDFLSNHFTIARFRC
jgi:hypothetical protein